MKVAPLFLLILLNSSLFAQKNYKGTPKHDQLEIEVLPKSTEYIFNQGLEDALEDKLNQKIDELLKVHKVAGITATILIPEKGIWQTNKGFLSKPDQKIVDSSSVFYWASVGKLITSTITHQLVLEGKLSLNDKLHKWYPDIQNSKKITISQLLAHTNGIYSFNADPALQANDKSLDPPELLKVSKAHENLFKPGKYWSYSNTGYVLLALIIEKVTSKTFGQVVQEKISDPLELKALKTLKAPIEMPLNLALAHTKDVVVHKDSYGPLGAGNIVSNSKDIAVFLSALLTGKIIPLELVHGMITDLYPMFNKGQYYGKGIMLYDFHEIDNTDRAWIGHSGGTENYKAIALFDINSKIIMAISINENIQAEAVALRLMELIH